jgi:hypothetical protein
MGLGHNLVVVIGHQPYWTPQVDMPIECRIVHILRCSLLLIDQFYVGGNNR